MVKIRKQCLEGRIDNLEQIVSNLQKQIDLLIKKCWNVVGDL